MAHAMHMFRKRQKVMLAILGVLCMFGFVFAGAQGFFGDAREAPDPVVATTRYGKIHQSELQHTQIVRRGVLDFINGLLQTAQQEAFKGRKFDWRPNQELFPLGLAVNEESAVTVANVARKAADLGIVVSDDSVNQYLRDLTGDIVPGDTVNALIAGVTQRNLSTEQLYNGLRREIQAIRLRQLLLTGQTPDTLPPAQRWAYYQKLKQRAKVELVAVPAASFVGEVAEPTDQEIVALFEKYKDRLPNKFSAEPGFRVPHKVGLEYLRADFEKFKKQVEADVTDEEILAHYETNKDNLYQTDKSKGFDTEKKTPAGDEPATNESKGEGTTEEGDKPEGDAPADKKKPADVPEEGEKPADVPEEGEKPADVPEEGEKPAEADKPKAEPEATPDATKPAAEKSATEKPATPKPEAAKPAAPAEKKPQSSLTPRDSRISLVSFNQAENELKQPVATPAGEKPAAAAPAKEVPAEEAGDKPANPASKPAEDKPVDDKPADEAKPEGEEKTEETKPDGEKPAEPADKEETPAVKEYKPLDEVKDQIRSQLAGNKAREKIKAVFEELKAKLEDYRFKLLSAGKGADNLPQPPDMEAFAAEKGLERRVISPTAFTDLDADGEFGQSYVFNEANRFQPVRAIMLLFSRLQVQQPEISQSLGGDQFLFWKTSDEKEHTASLTDAGVREQVVKAWKLERAREPARKKAQALADEAKEKKESLREIFAGQTDVVVTETEFFPWMVGGRRTPEGQYQPPQYGTVVGVEAAGSDFMEAVFNMQPGEVSVAMDHPKNVAYVIRLIELEKLLPVLERSFLADNSSVYDDLAMMDRNALESDWLEKLNEEAGLNWERPPTDLANAE